MCHFVYQYTHPFKYVITTPIYTFLLHLSTFSKTESVIVNVNVDGDVDVDVCLSVVVKIERSA